LQEGGAPFQTTHWTVVLQAGVAESDGSSKKRRTWLSYACWLYQAKKDSLSQAASAASELRYELAARIARTFANFAAKAIAPFGKF
jgi:predicted HTH domain antitoxin